ncbi:flavoprotein [Streptomonospora sp. S1-112]|uniref:Flavoprotein n=1 Tax=Streptomonospora mangrovi TaxID=2883123 RepID=A0A9X3SCK8_9ACTN|nr:flavoprotein [Streptomonospora mangrovi]MDA0563788.1 flavoprotein [Streptomonospora mangrovi]
MDERALYLVVTGAPARDAPVARLVAEAQRRGWAVTVISTPMGTRFHDPDELERLTGAAPRVDFRRPGTGQRLVPPDALLACPLTFNSLNKIAAGFADTMAVAVVCEMLGYGVPTVAVPHVNAPLARHAAVEPSIAALRSMGARVLFDPDAPAERRTPPWDRVLDAVEEVWHRRPQPRAATDPP